MKKQRRSVRRSRGLRRTCGECGFIVCLFFLLRLRFASTQQQLFLIFFFFVSLLFLSIFRINPICHCFFSTFPSVGHFLFYALSPNKTKRQEQRRQQHIHAHKHARRRRARVVPPWGSLQLSALLLWSSSIANITYSALFFFSSVFYFCRIVHPETTEKWMPGVARRDTVTRMACVASVRLYTHAVMGPFPFFFTAAAAVVAREQGWPFSADEGITLIPVLILVFLFAPRVTRAVRVVM